MTEPHPTGSSRPIFRSEALARYSRRRDEAVFPKLIAPGGFLLLWALVGTCLVCAILACFSKIPLYARGVAFVAVEKKESRPALILLFPAEVLPQLHPGLRVDLKSNHGRTEIVIDRVEPEVYSPVSLKNRFDLGPMAALLLYNGKDVAIARLDPAGAAAPGLSTALGAPSPTEAIVQVGSERTLALLPFIGRFFDPSSNRAH